MIKNKEKIMSAVFFASALTSILAVALICLFLLANGLPAMGKIGVFQFLLGKEWAPVDTPPVFGIFPMILGSIYVCWEYRWGSLPQCFLLRSAPQSSIK